MLISGKLMTSIWCEHEDVFVIDQRWLPHELKIVKLETLDEFCVAIKDMYVRGAPLIGVTAAFGVAKEMQRDASDESLQTAYGRLLGTRPTAINLKWALDDLVASLAPFPPERRKAECIEIAQAIRLQELRNSREIGNFGADLIEAIAKKKNEKTVSVLTHCNAGWLATVDYGTATAPIYEAKTRGIDVHVFVDETRPRNQGAQLTSWELGENEIPHTLIVDNAGGHLMQHGDVDLVMVGTDRTTATGDVCNKIGTYLKALAAYDNDVPFYVALPSSTIDWTVSDGLAEIPIEKRSSDEVTHVQGKNLNGEISSVLISPENTVAANPAFDVTPARLITGLITERGVCKASAVGLDGLFK
jgi:methylthioribose-1-phosphate isomerase